MRRAITEESRALMIYQNHYEMLSELSDSQRGKLVLALLDYANSGVEPDFKGGLRIAYVELRGDVDRSIERWETECRRRSDAGKKSAALRAAKNFTPEVSCNDSSDDDADEAEPENDPCASAAPEGALSSVEDCSTESTNQNQNQNHNQNQNQKRLTPRNPPGGDADFDQFWERYPRKVGKKNARRAFVRADVPLERMLEALEQQKKDPQWRRDGGRFIPNPATWLNQGRWDDEGSPARTGLTCADLGVETI